MPPRDRHSVTADTNLDAMHMHGPVITPAHIIFTAPDQFDWRATKSFGDQGCFARDVRIGRRAPAKTAAGKLSMKSILVRLQTEHFGNYRLVHRLKLRR